MNQTYTLTVDGHDIDKIICPALIERQKQEIIYWFCKVNEISDRGVSLIPAINRQIAAKVIKGVAQGLYSNNRPTHSVSQME